MPYPSQNIQIPYLAQILITLAIHPLSSGGSSHPQHIMISPLNIHRMMADQLVHDNMGTGSSVINISPQCAGDLPSASGSLRLSHNKLLCPTCLNNRADNGIIIVFFIQHIRFLCDQLFDHVSEILRQGLSYLRTGIFAHSTLAYLDQPVQRDLVPVFHVWFLPPDPIHHFLWDNK